MPAQRPHTSCDPNSSSPADSPRTASHIPLTRLERPQQLLCSLDHLHTLEPVIALCCVSNSARPGLHLPRAGGFRIRECEMTSALRNSGSTTRWRKIRAHVLWRDKGVCWLCGSRGATHVDHVIPRSKGGTDDLSNCRAACASCNLRKGNRLLKGTAMTQPTTSRLW